MRSAKSTNSLSNTQQQAHNLNEVGSTIQQAATNSSNSGPTSPICRCRVMYLGSSVPHITKDGLQGIQEPLRELYPDKSSLASGNAGIDSWLSVWSNGILIENVDETGREVKRFFKIDALHYCAAVKYVPSPSNQQQQQLNSPYTTLPNGHLNNNNNNSNNNNQVLPKFLPLDSPHARQSNSNPPIFASIIRRTTGIKVLECHAFICKREAAANALVRCCFHAYADTMYAKQIGADVNNISTTNDINNNNSSSSKTLRPHSNARQYDSVDHQLNGGGMAKRRSKSIAALNDTGDPYLMQRINPNAQNDVNHQLDRQSMTRGPSMNEQHYTTNCDNNDNGQQQLFNGTGDQLRKQQKLSKSMHHLNHNNPQNMGMTYQQLMMDQANDYEGFLSSQSTSASCINGLNGRWQQQKDPRFMQQVNQQPPFYNPQAGRVPSYPPQNLMDAANNGGTLRSIKSMAANSIASTLLRSKKHAKAMSMAQLNQDKITSFHQPHNSNASTLGGTMLMPPVPPMFLPNLPGRSIINGSQTMKPLSKPMMPIMAAPMNYEAMTPKEMKKLLKKSAKYGIDPNKFGENGLPLLPLRAPPMPPPPPSCHIPPLSKGGTMVSQSMFLDMYGNEMPEMAGHPSGLPTSRGPMPDQMDATMLKPILVKPNPEFLKSKAGKKWLKQQKEFKKLLPPHLDGLPIIFGPPPVDALEPAGIPPNANIQAPTFIPPPHPGLPMMDSSGYYNPHPFYGQTGRASAASTLLRYSPNSQLLHENANNGLIPPHPNDADFMHKNHIMYNNNGNNIAPYMIPPTRDFLQADNSSLVYGNNECGIDPHLQRNFLDNGHQKRHMVEQSVISLGDENDYDDEVDEEQQNGYYSTASIHNSDINNPRRSKSGQSATAKHSNRESHGGNDHSVSNYQDKGVFNHHQGYSDQNNDDQSSYSSGIYKRGHINERAFSYSIRQEHKSSGNNSNPEYASRNETLPDNDRLDQQIKCHINQHDNQQHTSNMFGQAKRDQNDEYYHRDGNDPQILPVNELTARLESQLNMKSFANSRIKSQM